MDIVKKILIGLGGFFVVLIILGIFVTGAAFNFEKRHKDFAINYTKDFSQTWSVQTVSDRMTNGMLEQLNSAEGPKLFRPLKCSVKWKTLLILN